jgi:hypothetical protein
MALSTLLDQDTIPFMVKSQALSICVNGARVLCLRQGTDHFFATSFTLADNANAAPIAAERRIHQHERELQVAREQATEEGVVAMRCGWLGCQSCPCVQLNAVLAVCPRCMNVGQTSTDC